MGLKLLIAVPSKNRYQPDGIFKYTWNWLKHSKYVNCAKIFVEPKEFSKYVKAGMPPRHLVCISDCDRGLGFVKTEIQKYALRNKYDVIFKIDDDFNYWRYLEHRLTGSKIPKMTIEEKTEIMFDPMVERCVSLLEEIPEIGAIGQPYRHQMYEFTGDMWLTMNNRLQGSYLVRSHLMNPELGEYIKCYDDFVTTFNVLKNGYFIVKYGLCEINYDIMKNPGGLQDFNRRKVALESKEIIEALWPDVVWKKVEGKNWDYEPDIHNTKFIKGTKI
jgi:hypothetical protein